MRHNSHCHKKHLGMEWLKSNIVRTPYSIDEQTQGLNHLSSNENGVKLRIQVVLSFSCIVAYAGGLQHIKGFPNDP